jgi:hypothetical protein
MIDLRTAAESDAESIARIRVMSWKTAYHGLVTETFLDKLRADDRVVG